MENRSNEAAISALKSELFSSLNKIRVIIEGIGKSKSFLSGIGAFFFVPKLQLPILNQANSLHEVLKVVLDMEKNIYVFINIELSKLDKKKPLNAQAKALANICSCLTILNEMNKKLVDKAPSILLELCNSSDNVDRELGKKIQFIYELLKAEPYSSENAKAKYSKLIDESTARSKLFLATIRNLILLTLLKIAMGTNGNKFIDALYETLSKNNHYIQIRLSDSMSQSSLAEMHALELSSKAYANYPYPTVDASRLDAVQAFIASLSNYRNDGTSSGFEFPLAFRTPTDYMEYSGVYFRNQESIDYALTNFCQGTIAFNETGDPYYVPLHMVILHELIHALHNSQGINIGHLTISENDEFALLWQNLEEYATIFAATFSESLFNRDLGYDFNRFGHNSISEITFLNINDPTAQLSLDEISGINPKNTSFRTENR